MKTIEHRTKFMYTLLLFAKLRDYSNFFGLRSTENVQKSQPMNFLHVCVKNYLALDVHLLFSAPTHTTNVNVLLNNFIWKYSRRLGENFLVL